MNMLKKIVLAFQTMIIVPFFGPMVSIDTIKIEQFTDLVQKSEKFHTALSFPILNNRIALVANNDQKQQQEIVNQAHAVRPIIHVSFMVLIREFLSHKREYG